MDTLDLRGLLGTLREAGAVAPIGVEVFSDELHALDPTEAGRRAGTALRSLLSLWSDSPRSGG